MLFCAAMVLGCAKTSKEDHLATIVASFGYKVIATDESKTYYPLENFDRKTYGPISFESARIKSLQPLAGYHGPTYGDYFLSIEKYGTATDAEKRVNEYRDNDRLARITGRDRNDLSKESVRCWGYSSGKTAYLVSEKKPTIPYSAKASSAPRPANVTTQTTHLQHTARK